MKVFNNKPFVLKYKSHNTISIPKQFITDMYSIGNASPKAYRFWRLETARSVPATSLSRPTQLFVHSRAHRRLSANTSCRIKRCSDWYHPRRYRLQRFRTETAECACTLNAKSRTRRLLWIWTQPVQEKRFCWHDLSYSAWPSRWRSNNLGKTESFSKVCMCWVSSQQWPSTQITLFERTRQSVWLDAVTKPLTRSEWILERSNQKIFQKPRNCSLWRATHVMFSDIFFPWFLLFGLYLCS